MQVIRRFCCLGVAVAMGGCSGDGSQTALNPAGPPMIQQVFVQERVSVDIGGNRVKRVQPQLAFGMHPDIAPADDPQDGVNMAVITTQRIRIVLDELLQPHTLEQVQCGREVPSLGGGALFSDISPGATPEDINDCLGADRSDCKVACTQLFSDNQPIGILDANNDGTVDNFRFKPDTLTILCSGVEIPYVLESTFWNPSGNQQLPSDTTGVQKLGPAIVVVPVGLRGSSQCSIEIADSVVDKNDGLAICAPENGDISAGCPAPGDTSEVEFGTEPFELLFSSVADGATGVAVDVAPQRDEIFNLQFSAFLDATTVERGISLRNVEMDMRVPIRINSVEAALREVTILTELEPLTTYELAVAGGSDGVLDLYGAELLAEDTFTFTTANVQPLADAGISDAGGGVDASTP